MLNSFNQLPLKSKLLIIFGFFCSVSSILGFVGYFSLKKVTAEYSWVTNISIHKIELADEMYLNYQRARFNLQSLGLPGTSTNNADQAILETQNAILKFEENYKKYTEIENLPGEEKFNKSLESSWHNFKEASQRILALQKSGKSEDHEKMIEIFFTESIEKEKSFVDTINKISDFHRGQGNERAIQANTTAIWSSKLMLGVSFTGILFSVFLGFSFSRSIIKNLNSVVDSLTQGNAKLSAEVSALNHSSSELSGSSSQQAAAIQETSASVEQIRAMVEKNSENANSSAETSALSREQAEKGNAVVTEMIQSMAAIENGNEKIMEEITESNKRISEVVNLIQDIGSKTNVINDIVFQTKLLSFNASVEAARAGEQGKGFAVVAEEVGNLAQMSGNAAKEISDMLAGSVAKVESLVRETKDKVEKLMAEAKITVSRGGEVARECGGMLNQIVNNAREVSDKVREISAASAEQATGVTEISKAILTSREFCYHIL